MSTGSETPSSSSPSHKHPCFKHDVFLSFRGEDTRDNFTNHLYHALRRRGIETFIDDDLRRGEIISPALLRAIEDSRICIIVFSENYASSKWCLDELVHILECKTEEGTVKPVFYKVDPSHIRKLECSFGSALAEHERKFKRFSMMTWIRSLVTRWWSSDDDFEVDLNKLEGWRKALTDSANVGGWHYENGPEYQFIEDIAEDISEQVQSYCDFKVADHPVGLQSRVNDIHRSLKFGDDDVRMIGIWGIGGSGKTTIAKAVYNSLADKFDGKKFVENVGKLSMDQGGIMMDLEKNCERMRVMERRFRKKKVLLILDGVNELNHLTELFGNLSWFGSGSRIIITTRDKRLLTNPQVKEICIPRELADDDALKLFFANAFPNGENIPDDYEQLAKLLVQRAEGLPSALISLGTELCGRTLAQWQEELDAPFVHLQSCLYDSLQLDLKNVFLDIACFFNGQDKNQVLQILKSRGKPDTNVSKLEEKALISIDKENNRILMRKMLQEMGKEKAQEESNDVSERSRLWFSNDVYDVLAECRGSAKIRGVKMIFPTEEIPVIPLRDRSFSEMRNLEILINSNAIFSNPLENLPNNLKLIDWPDFPFQGLPVNFIAKKLVKLSMPCSRMRQLGVEFEGCRYLKYLNLERSDYLSEVSNFSECPNLQELNLSYCRRLIKVDQAVGRLVKLEVLNLSGCESLTGFPGIIALKSVKYIDLSGCTELSTFCEIVEDTEVLTTLDLSGTAISELPRSIDQLHGLKNLVLQNCSRLVTFTRENIDQILPTSLRNLNLCGCKNLQEIPELPPNVEQVIADGCESLERFAVLSNILERKPSQMIKQISLYNCRSICDHLPHSVAGNEGSLFSLIHSSKKQSQFNIVFPGSGVPSWFLHERRVMELVGEYEFRFEVLSNFNKGLAICASANATGNSGKCSFDAEIYISGESKGTHSFIFEASKMQNYGHMWLLYIPLDELGRCPSPFSCQVKVNLAGQSSVSCRYYGVHLVTPLDVYEDHSDDED